MTLLRWFFAGNLMAAAIAAIVIGLASSGDAASQPSPSPVVPDTSEVGSSPSPLTQSAPRPLLAGPTFEDDAEFEVFEVLPQPPLEATDPAVSSTAHSAPTPQASQVSPQPSAGAAVPATGQVRLRIPTLGVDAAVSALGFDGAGGYAVPGTAAGVGWYEFSAAPGAPGNTVLGGHLNWRGSRGVFDRIDELSVGDLIYLDSSDGELVYRVSVSYSVTAQTPFAEILGERSGPSTLTLFTCGGTFSSAAGEYDRRTVVAAVRS